MMTMMRVSKDEADKAYSPTANQRRVWSNDQEVLNWITADEFRRVVITSDGRVHNGSVRIERLPEDRPPEVHVDPAPEPTMPADVGFAGAGLVFVKPQVQPAAAPEPIPAAEVLDAEILGERPGVPDEVVVDTQSERLPDNTSQD